MTDSQPFVECTVPVLPVTNLLSSIAFYTETLEFTLDWKTEKVCSVSRDGCCIMLSEMLGSTAQSWVWIGLRDETLFDLYVSRGVKVQQEPTNQTWAYEMKLEDIDGNILWLGTAPRTKSDDS